MWRPSTSRSVSPCGARYLAYERDRIARGGRRLTVSDGASTVVLYASGTPAARSSSTIALIERPTGVVRQPLGRVLPDRAERRGAEQRGEQPTFHGADTTMASSRISYAKVREVRQQRQDACRRLRLDAAQHCVAGVSFGQWRLGIRHGGPFRALPRRRRRTSCGRRARPAGRSRRPTPSVPRTRRSAATPRVPSARRSSCSSASTTISKPSPCDFDLPFANAEHDPLPSTVTMNCVPMCTTSPAGVCTASIGAGLPASSRAAAESK